jgi:hypothetical protein
MCSRVPLAPSSSGFTISQIGAIRGHANVRLIRHEAVPKCGSYEVRFLAGKPSRYFYWEDLPSRRLRREQMTDEEALEQARAFRRVWLPGHANATA